MLGTLPRISLGQFNLVPIKILALVSNWQFSIITSSWLILVLMDILPFSPPKKVSKNIFGLKIFYFNDLPKYYSNTLMRLIFQFFLREHNCFVSPSLHQCEIKQSWIKIYRQPSLFAVLVFAVLVFAVLVFAVLVFAVLIFAVLS